MKAAVIIATLFLSGCASPVGQGSRALPWNWFHADANARVAQSVERKTEAEQAALEAAHVETVKAAVALNYAPASPSVEFARRTLGLGNGLLTQVAALSAERESQARNLVVDLFTGSPEKAGAANRQQTKAEAGAARVSRQLTEKTEDMTAAQAKLADANLENAGAAAKYRRLWFWIYAIAGGWLVLQLLSGIARFYPALAPVARIAGFFSAPAVQAAYERTTGAVSRAIADASRVSDHAVETLRDHLDGSLDETDKRAIRAKVLTELQS